MFSIYKYTFPNGKIYIGKTKSSIEDRAGSNGVRYGNRTLVGRAIRKYGWVNVKKEIIMSGLSSSQANEKEIELIKELNATDRSVGYNLTKGGDGGAVKGHIVSLETRRKIGEKNRIARLAGITLAVMVFIAVILGIGQRHFGWTRAFTKWVVYICPLYRAGEFIIGLVAGYVFVSNHKSLVGGLHTAMQFIVIALMTVQVFFYCTGNTATNWTLTLFWLPTSVLCIYLFAVNGGIISKVLSRSKYLVWIGNVSGEAFLIHQICIKGVEYLIKNMWIVAIVAFGVTLIAVVVWRWLYARVQSQLLHRRGE